MCYLNLHKAILPRITLKVGQNSLIVIIILFSLATPKSNAEVLRFEQLDVRDGLPDNAIRAITQDKLGYIWFGTELGLARFDGVSIRQYIADDTRPNTIADSYVRSIDVDDNNTLWISSGNSGLSKYNRDTDDFTVFNHVENNSSSISSNSITKILHSDENIIWIATDKGIDRFNSKTELFKHFSHYLNDNLELVSASNGNIRTLFESRNKIIWSGSNKGLSIYDTNLDAFRLLNIRIGGQPEILSIAQRTKNELWLGTKEGLFVYQIESQSLIKFDLKNEVKQVHSLLVDNDNNTWVGTARFGLFRVNSNNNVIRMKPDKSDKNAITDVTILDIMQDHSGIIWVATYRSGVNFFNPISLMFGSQNNSLNSLNCLKTTDIRSAQALDNNMVLLGTTRGVSEINLKEKKCERDYAPSETKERFSDSGIYAIYVDALGGRWFGGHTGLFKYNLDTQMLEPQIENDNSNERIGVYSITPFSDKLLLATNNGVYQFQPSTKSMSKIPSPAAEFEDSYVFSVVVDSNNIIWAASANGLFRISEKLDYFEPVMKENRRLIEKEVWGIALDKEDNIWLAIEEQGLFMYTPKTEQFEAIGERLGIIIKNGVGGLNRSDNDMWFTTYNKGIFRINLTNFDVQSYSSADGLHSELFNRNAYTQFKDGRLLFAGKTGFNVFDPTDLQESIHPPRVSLSQLKRFGKVVVPHKNYDGLEIEDHISNIDFLSLSHRDKIFGFEFIAMDYLQPTKIVYAYMLKGFDQDWTETSTLDRGVTYNNIGPGEYVFRVKAKNARGVWSEKDVALNISIAPAPWLTWWAYTVYAISFILLIWLTFNKRTQWLKKRAIELENTVNIRTNELAKEKEKVEQLLSRKNEEFANISHEFRTPLTLILGPINQLIAKSRDEILVSKLDIVRRNALRLLRIVDQLLNLETFRVKAITQKSSQAISKITQLVAEAFSDLAEEKKVSFYIKQIDSVCFDFTPDAIEKIVLNLLSNAIKYTKSGGNITVSAIRKNSQYQIQVTDTGIGIAKDKLSKVFERFNRVMDENSEQVTGSGIGLSLVKSLVESHCGSVELESELGRGSTITVTLPIINEVDESQINIHQNDEIIAMELMNVSSSTLHENSMVESIETVQSSSKPTVLVIEDNNDMRQYIVESISPQFNTLVAADGQAGLEIAIKEVPDLIISDIMMPKLDGYQTTKALRETQITNHIPVVLLTARGDRDSRLKGWEEKADEYITKPFDVEELLIRISNLVEIRNILKRRFSETVFEQPESTSEQPKEEIESLSIVEVNTQRLQQEFIEQLNLHIESVYTEAEVAVIDLAKLVNMSERQFYRKLRSVVDMTPSEYLRRFRLEKSKDVLRSGKTANFAAFEVGFSSQAYFSRCFKAQYNMTPKQFVNQN